MFLPRVKHLQRELSWNIRRQRRYLRVDNPFPHGELGHCLALKEAITVRCKVADPLELYREGWVRQCKSLLLLKSISWCSSLCLFFAHVVSRDDIEFIEIKRQLTSLKKTHNTHICLKAEIPGTLRGWHEWEFIEELYMLALEISSLLVCLMIG